MINMMEYGNSVRTTHATSSNDTSSRSHAICLINIKEGQTGKIIGKLLLVDLAV
jgi:kinesin family protein 2/24